jgi:hypothetical protein
MEARILRKDNVLYLQLPSEFSSAGDIELFKLKDGYYLLSLQLGQKKKEAQGKQALSDNEKSLLKKLSAIKFENRTPKNISQSLSQDERNLLSSMEKKGFVQLFKSAKYKEGVYSIPDDVYPLLKENNPPGNPQQSSSQSPLASFFKEGFVVFSNNNEAAAFSDLLKKSGHSQDIFGIKGFDGRFYVVTKSYMMDMSGKVRTVLKGNNTMTSTMIAKACNMDDSGCRAVLLLMAEKGDVIEKKKDIFVLV